MDLIFRLIEFLVQELLKNQNRNRTQPPAQSSLPGAAAAPARANPARANPPPAQAMAPRPRPASQDPVYDDRGWRLALTVLALIVLIIMVGVWIAYVRGGQ